MSVLVISAVFAHSRAKLSARLVLVCLADAAHNDGITWVGQKEIAQRTLLSESEVRRSLDELDRLGEIERRKAQRGRRRINVYRVTLPSVLPSRPADDLPFALTEPFSTTAHLARSPDSDDRSSSRSTTAHLARSPNKEGPVSRTVKGDTSSLLGAAPPLIKVEGRNLGFDALAETCRIDVRNRTRSGEIAAALKDIRAYVSEDFPDLAGEPFEHQVAAEVTRRGDLYRRTMRDAALTPTALAKWWHDVERGGAKRGLTAADVPDLDDLG